MSVLCQLFTKVLVFCGSIGFAVGVGKVAGVGVVTVSVDCMLFCCCDSGCWPLSLLCCCVV